jgi:hypothetical protein
VRQADGERGIGQAPGAGGLFVCRVEAGIAGGEQWGLGQAALDGGFERQWRVRGMRRGERRPDKGERKARRRSAPGKGGKRHGNVTPEIQGSVAGATASRRQAVA